MKMRKMHQFFDPYKQEHLEAYMTLKKTGFWPKDFIPDDVQFEEYWLINIVAKMAQAWLSHRNVPDYLGPKASK